MWFRVLLVALLFFPSPAVAGSSSMVPPVGGYSLVRGSCPYFPQASGCLDVNTETVYVRRNMGVQFERETLQHELGHLYDWRYVDDEEEKAFWEIARRSRWAGAFHFAERFADAYMVCSLGYTPGHSSWRVKNPRKNPIAREVCRHISMSKGGNHAVEDTVPNGHGVR